MLYGVLYNIDTVKTGKQLERYFKGAANHMRLDIMNVVNKNEGITLEEITEILDHNMKTISAHTRSLLHAGLLNKKYEGRHVVHFLSPYGKRFIEFIKSF